MVPISHWCANIFMATTSENVPLDMWVQRRFRSGYAFAHNITQLQQIRTRVVRTTKTQIRLR